MITARIRRLVVLGLALILVSSLVLSPTAYAQDSASTLTSNTQTLAAGLQHWYHFDYAGGNRPFRVTLDVTPAGSAGFQVWTADQIPQLTSNVDIAPFAAGTPEANNPARIVWESSFADPASYVIVVQPSTNAGTQYVLNVVGFESATLPSVAIPPANVTTVAAVPTAGLNVRSGPSTAFSVIRTVPAGTQMTVLGRDDTSSWLSVQLSDGTQGWVAQFLTTFIGTAPAVATLPLVQPPLAPPPVVPVQAAPAAAVNVNVRSGPATAFSVIRTVPAGTVVTVLGQDATGAWLSIQLSDGTQGWMARFLTNFTATAPIVATPALTQPPLAPPPTIPTISVQPAPAITPNANVRTGPSMAFPVIRTVLAGTQMSVLGQDTTGAWLLVQFSDGAQGWIARSLTNFVDTAPIMATPALTQPPLAPPATVMTAQPGVAALPGLADSLADPPVEQALGRNWRILRPGQIHWYSFDHPGDETAVQLWLDSEPNDGAGFRVFKEADAQAVMSGAFPDDIEAIGRGTPNPNEAGDLFWRGDFTEHGRFYVMVENGGTRDINYTIFGAGPSVAGIAPAQ